MMKRILLSVLMIALLLSGLAGVAEDWRPDEDNAINLARLLIDLVYAYENPESDDSPRIDADLDAIRAVSASDYEIASAIAEHWRAVYLDPSYTLYLYSGGDRATELEAAGIADGDIGAIVVLGYELENGEMTRELMGRCDAAAAVARSFPSAILICSGGATGDNNPDNHTEAGMMKAYLTRKCGIDPARIFIDERAMTTVDNALNTFEILEAQDIRRMTIVTSSYHQRWGQAIYNAVGAIYRQRHGFSVEIVGNYSYDIAPSRDAYRKDDQVAARQLARVLNLPQEALDAAKR